MSSTINRMRANKALSRLRKRISYWQNKYHKESMRFSRCNDELGNALFREQDPKSGYLAEIMRLKKLKWENGKLADINA